jgi:hypothetical protein
MRLLLIIFLIALPALAQDATSTASQLKTFTSPDGTFQFTYPDILIRCELRPEAGGAHAWVQQECVSYHPVCGNGVDPDDPIVCLAYPRDRYTNTEAFEAAAFSVSETTISEKECLSDEVRKGKIVVVNGAKFYFNEDSDAGMNQAGHSKDYVTFHNGRCVVIATAVATANPGVFDPPAKAMTEQDWAEVYGKLNQARDSFRFLK